MWPNEHHLMLFYFVARHGGIAPALPHLPYGLQASAVSGQLHALQRDIERQLYTTRPFRLSRAGAQLYAHIAPMFSSLPAVADALRHGDGPLLRVGAPELVVREYFPHIVTTLRRKVPGLRFKFRCGQLQDFAQALHADELDLAIAAADVKPPGLEARLLARVPLVLLAPRRPKPRLDPRKLLRPGRIARPLVCTAPGHVICEHFHRQLAARRIVWPTTLETASVGLVTWFVAARHGLGVGLDLPAFQRHPDLRLFALPDFAPVDVHAFFRPSAPELVGKLLTALPADSPRAPKAGA